MVQTIWKSYQILLSFTIILLLLLRLYTPCPVSSQWLFRCDNFSVFFLAISFTTFPRCVPRWYRISDYCPPKNKRTGSTACCYLTPVHWSLLLSRKLMKTNLSFLNKCEEDAYQKLISGFNGNEWERWEEAKGKNADNF